MKIKSQRDFWTGLLYLLTGMGFAWGAAVNYSFGDSARPGPGYFPFGLGVLLALIGALVLFTALSIETHGGDRIGEIAWRPLVVVLGSVALFGFLLPRLGLLATLPILIVVATLAGDEFHLGQTLLSAAVLTAASWLIFIKGLGLVIPLWPAFLA